jgi:hypothetical protein
MPSCVAVVAIVVEGIAVVLAVVLEGAVKDLHLVPHLEEQNQHASFVRKLGARSYAVGSILIVTTPEKRSRRIMLTLWGTTSIRRGTLTLAQLIISQVS